MDKAVEFCAECTSGFQQHQRAGHICIDGDGGGQNTAVDVRFCSKVHDPGGLELLKQRINGIRVANIDAFEAIARMTFDGLEIVEVSRVRPLVDIEDLHFMVNCQHPPYEGRSDESRATRHHQFH